MGAVPETAIVREAVYFGKRLGDGISVGEHTDLADAGRVNQHSAAWQQVQFT